MPGCESSIGKDCAPPELVNGLGCGGAWRRQAAVVLVGALESLKELDAVSPLGFRSSSLATLWQLTELKDGSLRIWCSLLAGPDR